MNDIHNLKYTQVLDYLGVKKIEQTSFCQVYENEHTRFILFLNSDKDDKLSCFCVNNAKLIDKEELFFWASNSFKIPSNIYNYKLPEESKISEPVSLQVIEAFSLQLENLKPGHVINGYAISFIEDKVSIFKKRGEEKYSIPLYESDRLVNLLNFKEDGEVSCEWNNNDGYFLSSSIGGERSIIISSFPLQVFNFLKNYIPRDHIIVLTNPLLSFNSFCDLYSKIEKTGVNEILYLDNENDNGSYILNFISHYIKLSKGIDLRFSVSREITVTFSIPSEIKTINAMQFFSNLQSKALQKLGVANDNFERKNFLNEYLFSTSKSIFGDMRYIHVSFSNKKELLEIFTSELLSFYGEKNLSIVRDNESKKEEHSLF